MARTTRDEIWHRTLQETVAAENKVSVEDITEYVEASERTVRECLLSMHEEGYLSRHTTPSGTVRYAATDFFG
jgi:DeoR/GlpR family transcriptional regulator of sugar metabolism